MSNIEENIHLDIYIQDLRGYYMYDHACYWPSVRLKMFYLTPSPAMLISWLSPTLFASFFCNNLQGGNQT